VLQPRDAAPALGLGDAWSRFRRTVGLLGPAFVAAVAYVDPGNFATNTAAGAKFGYLLVWVVVAANALAMLVQYLSAKLGLATGQSLPQVCRDRYPRLVVWGLWVQAELVAIATDLAEVLGGAIALQLLFGVPLLVGALITGVVTVALLAIQSERGQRRYEHVVIALLAVVLLGFLYSTIAGGVDAASLGAGLAPRFDGRDSLLLAVGMLGATVMPHVVYLHSALVRDRYGERLADGPKRRLLRVVRIDVVVAMAVAGAVNLAMLVVAAGSLRGQGVESLTDAHDALGAALGSTASLLFALALLASGFASSSVGTYAGAVVLSGFLQRQIPLLARRLITLVPAILVVGVGIDPTRALVLSQVVLSFGIPFALWPLVLLTRRRDVMGGFVSRRRTTAAGIVTAALVTGLNVVLVASLVTA
jgi:manganese transport protein